MQYMKLGNSGLQVSNVGLGCMNFGMANDEAESAAVVECALNLGVNLFDTADVYGQRGKSEKWLGKALGPRRPEVVIATKFAGPMSSERDDMQGGSRRYIMQAVEASETWCWQRGLLTRCTLLHLEHILSDDYTSSSDLESEEEDV